MAKSKKPAPKKKAPPPPPVAKKSPPPPKKVVAAPPPPPPPAKNTHFDERRPDAPATHLAAHARQLAKQVRVDAVDLARAKVTLMDADRLELFADTLSAAEESWLALKDQRNPGGAAEARGPLREGRDQVYAALRTFARRNPDTQTALDRIGEVQDDDDLVNDSTRLLSLAKKHHVDLDGTDVTAERLTEVRQALNVFIAARAGERAASAASDAAADAESPAPVTAQAEDVMSRTARRARNRAYWMLAELDRDVVARGQYAFRKDPVRQAKYRGYRGSGGGSSTAAEAPAAPETPATK